MKISKLMFSVIGLILVTFCVWLIFFHTKTKNFKDVTNYPPRGNIIVAFGDSLTAGVGSTKGNDYVSLLSKKIDLPIINKGVPGDTTTAALKRFEDIKKVKPNIAIVYLGGNDVLQHVAIDTTFVNLEKIASHLQDEGALVILVGIRGGLFNDPYEARFKDLASRYHTVYISDLILSVMSKNNFMSDAVHPNDKGYEYIANSIYEATKDIFSKAKSL